MVSENQIEFIEKLSDEIRSVFLSGFRESPLIYVTFQYEFGLFGGGALLTMNSLYSQSQE